MSPAKSECTLNWYLEEGIIRRGVLRNRLQIDSRKLVRSCITGLYVYRVGRRENLAQDNYL